MDKYTIYGKPACGWCERAKDLLIREGIDYQYIDISIDTESKNFIVDQGFKTVPQIYHGDTHIGGYEDLLKDLN